MFAGTSCPPHRRLVHPYPLFPATVATLIIVWLLHRLTHCSQYSNQTYKIQRNQINGVPAQWHLLAVMQLRRILTCACEDFLFENTRVFSQNSDLLARASMA
jgi:hypothetical protein